MKDCWGRGWYQTWRRQSKVSEHSRSQEHTSRWSALKSQGWYNTHKNDATPISQRALRKWANRASWRSPPNLDNSNRSRNLASGAAARKTTHGKTAQQKTQSVTSATKKATLPQRVSHPNATMQWIKMGEVSSNREDFWSWFKGHSSQWPYTMAQGTQTRPNKERVPRSWKYKTVSPFQRSDH